MARDLDRQFRAEEAAAAAERARAESADRARAEAIAAAGSPPSRSPEVYVGQPAAQGHRPPPSGGQPGTRVVYKPMELAPGQRVTATPAQLKKLRADLAIVVQNAKLLKELLTGLGPNERARDNELIGEIATTCASMQGRVTELLEHVDNEALIVELLGANDELNDAQRALRLRASQETPGDGPNTAAPAAASGFGSDSRGAATAPPAPVGGADSYNAWLPGGQGQSMGVAAAHPHGAGAMHVPTRDPPKPPHGDPVGGSFGHGGAVEPGYVRKPPPVGLGLNTCDVYSETTCVLV
jgi:hypothetical protein